jgi:hypothetical protein
MTPSKFRIPEVGDRVGALGRYGVFAIVRVHTNPDVVDFRLLDGGTIEHGIPWTTLVYLDEEDVNQAAAQKG